MFAGGIKLIQAASENALGFSDKLTQLISIMLNPVVIDI